MSRRSLTLIIASIGTAAAIAVSVLVPVPYVILGPGPTLNTLGRDSSGQDLITIDGHASYPTSGNLNMVTVSYAGGPGYKINIWGALAGWINSDEAVVPESELFPSGQSAEQAQQEDTAEMAGSQEIADALRSLGKPVEFHVIEAPYGHDCFLLEEARQTPIIREFLGGHS